MTFLLLCKLGLTTKLRECGATQGKDRKHLPCRSSVQVRPATRTKPMSQHNVKQLIYTRPVHVSGGTHVWRVIFSGVMTNLPRPLCRSMERKRLTDTASLARPALGSG